jgi:predicted O-methyltransferase YrrM
MSAIQGWLLDEEADLLIASLFRAVSTLKGVRAIVEVGSYMGRSTVVLASVLQSLRLEDAKVYAVDPHSGKIGAPDRGIAHMPPSLDEFRRNVADAGVAALVQLVCHHSFEVQWDKPICFLFVDGLHDYMNVARDFYHFEPWIIIGGYIVFHDYAPYYPGVMMFVDEVLAGGSYERVHCAASLVVLRKVAEL